LEVDVSGFSDLNHITSAFNPEYLANKLFRGELLKTLEY